MEKRLTGVVVSDNMEKTIVVEVERTKQHPLYRKRMKRHKKYLVHDANEVAGVGDMVEIEETQPISKNKKWRLIEVMEESKT